MVLLLKLLLSYQLLFPGTFQRPGDEPMLRLNRVTLACGSLDFIGSSFSPLLPELLQLSSLLLYPLGRGERQLQSGRLQSGEDLLAHKGIEARTGQVLA